MNPKPKNMEDPTEEKVQPIKWAEIKYFVNKLTDEQLQMEAYTVIPEEPAIKVIAVDVVSDDIYRNPSDSDDCGTLKELQEQHGEDFNTEDYELTTKAGTPFLYAYYAF